MQTIKLHALEHNDTTKGFQLLMSAYLCQCQPANHFQKNAHVRRPLAVEYRAGVADNGQDPGCVGVTHEDQAEEERAHEVDHGIGAVSFGARLQAKTNDSMPSVIPYLGHYCHPSSHLASSMEHPAHTW